MAEEVHDATLRSVIDHATLKWIFVGGKGGVGKTTTSCALASILSRTRRSVLIISTDPAHNVSDAFGQKFSRTPTPVNGFDNLFAMEIDPSPQIDLESEFGGESGMSAESLQGMAANLPGIDELMSFAEMMRCVESYDYEVVVFDTAPTGHTLRLLQFPKMLNKMLTKLGSMRGMLGMAFNQFRAMAPGMPASADEASVLEKLDKVKDLSQRVSDMFTNPDMTTFVCVCIAEFLSLYETERLVQELARNSIDCHSIVVNQLLFPPKASNCSLCGARVRMQQKYTDQIAELYEDFNVVKIPLFEEEIRGTAALQTVGNLLVNAYQDPHL